MDFPLAMRRGGLWLMLLLLPAGLQAAPGADKLMDQLAGAASRYEQQERELAAEPEPLWYRLRDNLTLTDDRKRSEVQRWLRYYQRDEVHRRHIMQRAELYLPYLLNEVMRRGLPAELALLPIVESSLDPYAFSHGRAAGLWQMIPDTADRFAVRRNWWYDGRRDLIDSTEAALDYLVYLHEYFHGDWLLAIAAYNTGEGRVKRAVQGNAAAGKPQDFWHLKLPAETRDYVPKLLGLAALLHYPFLHDVTLPVIAGDVSFELVQLPRAMALHQAAKLAKLDQETLRALNAGFNRWTTTEASPQRLLLPQDAAARLREALQQQPSSGYAAWIRHRVVSGDTISRVARQYGTTARLLRKVNGLLGGDGLLPKQWLLVPGATRELDRDSMTLAQRAAARLQGRGVASEYRVEHGDTLWRIAARHGVTVAELRRWNQLKQDQPIHPGQQLQLRDAPKLAGGKVRKHKVQAGETLWALARTYKASVQSLRRWNGLASKDSIRVGQSLIVATRGQPATNRHLRQLYYTVRDGESLARISKKFSVSVADLRSWNGLGRKRKPAAGERLLLFVDVREQS